MDEREAEQIVQSLGVKADEFGIESLSDDERSVLVPWSALGVIENGGFKYFFEGSYDLGDVAQRLRTLGFAAAARACEEVLLAVFPGGHPPADRQMRREILSKIVWSQLRPHERVVWSVTWEDLGRAIATYIDRHSQAFEEVRKVVREQHRALNRKKGE